MIQNRNPLSSGFSFALGAPLCGALLLIGSSAGDCAPAPSHTTGRAGFSHPAVGLHAVLSFPRSRIGRLRKLRRIKTLPAPAPSFVDPG